MKCKYVALIAFAVLGGTMADASPVAKSDTPAETAPAQPAYQPQDNYVPHATYPYADTYPNSAYDGYLVPAGNVEYPQAGEYMSAIAPAAQTAMQIALKIFAKVGLFLIGGVALLLVGGVFTTAICSLTPFCTITFAGLRNINKDTMRAYVTPDALSAAAGFVQDAVGKYQRLQRAVGNQ